MLHAPASRARAASLTSAPSTVSWPHTDLPAATTAARRLLLLSTMGKNSHKRPATAAAAVAGTHASKRRQQQQSQKQQQQQLDDQQQQHDQQEKPPPSNWRLELFFKTHAELRGQLPFLRRHGLSRLNITNKCTDDDLLGTLAILQQEHQLQQQDGEAVAAAVAAGGTDVCLHYSCKYNSARSAEGSLDKLLALCSGLQQQQQQPVHVLLVSGGGKRRRFDSLAALQALAARRQEQEPEQLWLPRFAVAFNPYLPDSIAGSSDGGPDASSPAAAAAPAPAAGSQAAEERTRLASKVATGLVSAVYLQMGTDLARLQAGLAFLESLQAQRRQHQQPPLQLFGSVFLPSKRLLAQMRFRPWSGVFLSEEYLSGVGAANSITCKLLRAYAAAGVTPLLESAVRSEAELQQATTLLLASA